MIKSSGELFHVSSLTGKPHQKPNVCDRKWQHQLRVGLVSLLISSVACTVFQCIWADPQQTAYAHKRHARPILPVPFSFPTHQRVCKCAWLNKISTGGSCYVGNNDWLTYRLNLWTLCAYYSNSRSIHRHTLSLIVIAVWLLRCCPVCHCGCIRACHILISVCLAALLKQSVWVV